MRNFHKLAAAMAGLGLLTACGGEPESDTPQDAAATAGETGSPAGDDLDSGTNPDIAEADLRAIIAELSDDSYEGRAPGTPGGDKTRQYLAAEFERIGLEPVNGSYEQEVPIVESTLDPAQSSFTLSMNGETTPLVYREDVVFWTKRIEENVSFSDSDLVFVGYGIVAPEYDWNDYDGLDVQGKTVVMLVNDPGFATQDPELFNGNAMTYYGRWTYKYEEAARQGATAAIVIHETAPAAYGWNVVEGSWSGPQVDLQRNDDGASRVAAEGWFSYETAQSVFAAAGLDLKEQQAAALTPDFEAVPMTGISASAILANTIKRSSDANVLGVLPGATAPDEYVLYMGHWDHLGMNPDTEGEDKIYNGAIDNATGIAAILEIAEKFATRENRPDRSILILGVTAEESGLLGSAYFAETPPIPLSQIVAGVNIDAIIPSTSAKDMVVVGYGASELEDILQEAAAPYKVRLTPDPEAEKGYFYRSDHISLAKKGVPMLYADSGPDLIDGGIEAGEALGADYRTNDYHQVSDEYSEDWEMDSIIDTTNILYDTGAAIAYSSVWPNWYEGNEFRVLRDAQREGAE